MRGVHPSTFLQPFWRFLPAKERSSFCHQLVSLATCQLHLEGTSMLLKINNTTEQVTKEKNYVADPRQGYQCAEAAPTADDVQISGVSARWSS